MDADQLIAVLALEPHPEGGWFRETYRDRPADGHRGAVTQIYYLLKAGECSAWHRIDATEIWHFYLGGPLALLIRNTAPDEAGETAQRIVLGIDFAAGQSTHTVVPPFQWQSAESLGAFTLVGCTVAPAFRFEGFELAP